jgi:ribonuclease HII
MSLDLFSAQAIVCGQVEEWATSQGYASFVGLDEAGRGPLAGPVVAAAVSLPLQSKIEGLNDSKMVHARARLALYEQILSGCDAFGIASVSAREIDETNILIASLKAMGLAWQKAVARRPQLAESLVLVDGKQRATLPSNIEQRPLVKGDARSTNIAAASILAKVTRDRMMEEAHVSWPQYGFDQHKGYPTQAHRAAIATHGPCAIHRRSFRMLPEAK